MTLKIRETREKDFEKILKLLEETKLKDAYFSEENFKRMLERNKGYCYIAEDDGNLIGSAFGTHDGAFRGYIQKVAVQKEYRRRGIASKLVKQILQKLEESRVPLIFAHIEKTNTQSIELFKQLGFTIRDSHHLIDKGYKPR